MLARKCVYNKSSKNMYRTSVISRSSSSKRIFELHANVSTTNLEFVRDAYQACHHLSGECKDACYIVFGLDPVNVETYFPVVDAFERIYHKKYTKYADIAEDSQPNFKIGPFKFTFEKDE